MRPKLDTLITNITIVTVDAEFRVIPDGVVGIVDGRIERVGPRDADTPMPEADRILDGGGGLLIPGLVNAHTHLPMSLFRGLADDLPLMTWLNEHIFPAEAAHIDPATVRLGAQLSLAEVLLAGTTTICDGYFLEDSVGEAVHQAGIRAVIGQGVVDFPAPGVPDPAKNVAVAAAFADRWADASPLIRPSIFCHSPYTCSAATLASAKQAAADRGLLLQIHVGETRQETDDIRAAAGRSPVGFLDRAGILDGATLLVHGVWIDETDISVIAERKAGLVHCPESNMKLGSGVAPVPQSVAAGIPVGLGTDGCASNNNLDLFTEMDSAAKLHKVQTADPTVMAAATVLRMATIDGARALGLDREIGSIEVGKQADLVLLDTAAPHLFPMYNPVSHLVYAAKGADVRDVLVAGRFLVRDRRLLTIDAEAVMFQVNTLARNIAK